MNWSMEIGLLFRQVYPSSSKIEEIILAICTSCLVGLVGFVTFVPDFHSHLLNAPTKLSSSLGEQGSDEFHIHGVRPLSIMALFRLRVLQRVCAFLGEVVLCFHLCSNHGFDQKNAYAYHPLK